MYLAMYRRSRIVHAPPIVHTVGQISASEKPAVFPMVQYEQAPVDPVPRRYRKRSISREREFHAGYLIPNPRR